MNIQNAHEIKDQEHLDYLMARNPPIRVFVGRSRKLPISGKMSAIYKTPFHHRIALDIEGLEFDQQADRSLHGGPDKALLYYPDEHYTNLIDTFESTKILEGGVLGENISAWGWVESEVHIGDIFQIGTTRVQVTQPREPCLKIDESLGAEGMSMFLARKCMVGWYLRVLMPGHIEEGDSMILTRRMENSVSIATLWREYYTSRPDLKTLQSYLMLDGISDAWHEKISKRVRQLVAIAHGITK